jgi:AcrR family transcriptional regulator
MTELRLVESAPELRLAAVETTLPSPLPRGHHGLPADLVRAAQRQRLLEAAAAALAEQGYGRVTAARVTELAGVSSRTFYQHFEDLWACLLAAYEVEAARLCKEIERAAEAAGDGEPEIAGDGAVGGRRGRAGDATAGAGRERARAGIAAALAFLAAEPAPARLLSAEPPPQVAALAAARRDLVDRLGTMLRSILQPGGATPLPGLERRLIGAALALVSSRAAEGDPQRLRDLEPELTQILLATL